MKSERPRMCWQQQHQAWKQTHGAPLTQGWLSPVCSSQIPLWHKLLWSLTLSWHLQWHSNQSTHDDSLHFNFPRLHCSHCAPLFLFCVSMLHQCMISWHQLYHKDSIHNDKEVTVATFRHPCIMTCALQWMNLDGLINETQVSSQTFLFRSFEFSFC